MTRGDLVVVIACGVAGFWAVNAWLGLRGPPGRDEGDDKGRDKDGEPGRDTSRDPGRSNGKASGPSHGAAADAPMGDAARDPDAAATLSNWYRILGVREDADRETVVAAWRRKVSEYHPDKVARLGPEIRALAERRTQQVNAAYEIGMRLFR